MFIFEYIRSLDVSKLGTEDIRQCLLYLNFVSTRHPEREEQIKPIRKELTTRLEQIENESD